MLFIYDGAATSYKAVQNIGFIWLELYTGHRQIAITTVNIFKRKIHSPATLIGKSVTLLIYAVIQSEAGTCLGTVKVVKRRTHCPTSHSCACSDSKVSNVQVLALISGMQSYTLEVNGAMLLTLICSHWFQHYL